VTNFGFGKEPRANEDIICRSWLSGIWLPVQKPFLFLAAEEQASNPASAGIREDVGSQSNSCHVIVGGADHGSFTHANLCWQAASAENPHRTAVRLNEPRSRAYYPDLWSRNFLPSI